MREAIISKTTSTIRIPELFWVTALYIPLLVTWFTIDIRQRPIIFYLIFSLAITASVQLVGIYLVFASLIIPTLASHSIINQKNQLIIAYIVGGSGYFVGLIASFLLDLPTGAITVWSLLFVAILAKIFIRKHHAINS